MAATGMDVRFLAMADGELPAGAVITPWNAARGAGSLGVHVGKAPIGSALALPLIAIFCGRGSAYPYCGYYAHALACLGYQFSVVDGQDIAAGALDEHDLFVLPGGFATWGLDRCEGVTGADDAVRRFLTSGGSAIGSCGGAFYLSDGRPGWAGSRSGQPALYA